MRTEQIHPHSRATRVLHWGVAALLLGTFALGLYMHNIPDGAEKWALYGWHKAAGVAVLALVLARVGWRLARGAPGSVPGHGPWTRRVAGATHAALYAAMLAVPVSGIVMSWAAGYAVPVLGPSPFPKAPALAEVAGGLHEFFAFALIGLAALHAGAAVKHQVYDQDATLARMTWATIGARTGAALAVVGLLAVLAAFAVPKLL